MSDIPCVVRRHVWIEGRVQGVWYCETCRHRAAALGVAGWVRNRDDGRVEAVFEGGPTGVDAMVGWCRSGPPRAEVDRPAGALSTGQRRLVELARVLAGPFNVLLLDEPSSGLDRAESERLGQVLRNVVRERGTGILLVEHDVPLVREICDYLYVMDFGIKVFEGTPEEAVNSPIVQSAYLGTEGVEATVDDGQLEPAPVVSSADSGEL